MKLNRLWILALVLLVAGCSDSPTGPDRVSIDGTWTGSTSGITLSLTLRESDGSLSGSGSIGSGADAIALDLSGTRAGESVSFTLTSDGFSPLNFTGTVQSATSITGTLNGSGFSDLSISLAKP